MLREVKYSLDFKILKVPCSIFSDAGVISIEVL